jgi:hypothetical protein
MLYTGVYVPADPQFPKHFHGLGMRIEDEVLVGAEHPVILSANAPKEVCHPLSSLAPRLHGLRRSRTWRARVRERWDSGHSDSGTPLATAQLHKTYIQT